MEKELRENWDKILEHMRTQFSISNVIFRTFIQNLSVYSVTPSIRGDEDDLITIAIDDSQVGDSKKYIEEKFSVYLAVSIEEITAIHYEISFINLSEANLEKEETSSEDLISYERPYNPNLNKEYTFDTFIVGDNNNFAQAASLKVADEPGVSFNPLFIYGGSGLGKTHLMHAIAWYIKNQDPTRNVVYISAEQFLFKFVKALRYKDAAAFKEQFRSVDVLMIDDVQFLSNKAQTQEEFFYTFDSLMEGGRQIILSADKSPNDLDGIETRLKSRLNSGLVADIMPTDFDLRVGILNKKAEQLGIELPTTVTEFLAQKLSSNIRELDGSLKRIAAHSQFSSREITLEMTQDILKDMLRSMDRKTTIDEIQKKVAEFFNISVKEMQSSRRARNVARPRQIAMYLAKQLTSRSLPEIGRKFDRDHTTVMHAVRKVEELIVEDNSLAESVNALKKDLEN